MLDLALKMLLGDRAKYIMLISGLTFASLLMTEQAAIFCGIMQWSGSTLDNVGVRVRWVEGVAWAAPFYQGMVRTRMRDDRRLIGYGCDVGLASLFGMALLKKGMPPFFLPWQLPLVTLGAILFICWLAASLGIRKIRNLEPAVVFRG